MARIYSEAVQDKQSGKWGFYLRHEIDGVLLEPIYVFYSQQEAEQELIKALRELGDLARKG